MIVCSCNLLSDQCVRSAVEAERVHSIGQVYSCLGCRARCGQCAATIRRIINESLGGMEPPATSQRSQRNSGSTIADQHSGDADLPRDQTCTMYQRKN
jgi:bacterioferritin-associated ferredoxin